MANKRNEKIVKQYKNGLKMAEISKHFDITKQRVQQIISEKNIDTRKSQDYEEWHKAIKKQKNEIVEAIKELEQEEGYISHKLLHSDAFSFSPSLVRRRIGKLNKLAWELDVDLEEGELTVPQNNLSGKQYSDHTLLEKMYHFMEKKGRYFSIGEFNKEKELPGHMTYVHRFGGWRKSLNKARSLRHASKN